MNIASDMLYIPESTVADHGYDAYWPSNLPAIRTAVFIHGGGWLTGDKSDMSARALSLANKSWNVFNINYPLGNGKYQEALNSIHTAISLFKTFGCVDPSKVVLLGESAGGHLAACYANAYGGIRGVLTNCAPWDLSQATPELLPYVDAMRGSLSYQEVSPINNITSSIPIINMRGMQDSLIAEADNFRFHLDQMDRKSRDIAVYGQHALLDNLEFYDSTYFRLLAELSIS